jgi:hypothetical protein
MPEGRSVALSGMAALDPKIPDTLVQRAVDAALRPYFDALRLRAGGESLLAGFKFTRREEAAVEIQTEAPEEGVEPPEREEERQPVFFWFFFPVACNVVAWEASTGAGRATYFFRHAGAVAEAVADLTRGLALINFRREPIYLSSDALERESRFRRYAIGCRKLPELGGLRASFLGRAIHSTLDAWATQVDAILGLA